MADALAIEGLEVRYDGVRALYGVNLTVPAGTSLAVIGPNGSGKSTLLKAIAGIVTPSSGSVEAAAARPTLVLQSTDVDRSVPITVRDAIAMARYPSLGLLRRFGDADHAAVERAMARLAIDDLAQRQLSDLSGGQRQRVLVAQGLAQESSLLLLDEPVSGLDVVSRAVILDVVDEERSAGRTVVMTTHNLDEARRCDQVLLLASTPIACGPPPEVLCEAELRRAFSSRFLRDGNAFFLDDPHHVEL